MTDGTGDAVTPEEVPGGLLARLRAIGGVTPGS